MDSKNTRDFIPFGVPVIEEEDIQAVVDVLRSKWIGTGPKVLEFEKVFADYIGSPYARAVSSCTAALHLALLAAELKLDDEVITTSMTFVATVNAIEHAGCTPVLVDIEPSTFNICPDEIERAITKKTRAIMPVHFGGLPCNMERIHEIAECHGLVVIEDAAHAVGGMFGNRRIGSLPGSMATCFSFYPNKNMTTIEGGMVTTSSEVVAKKIELTRLHGQDREAWRRYSAGSELMLAEAVTDGFKYNMTDVSAALGLVQLSRVERFLERREEIAKIYDRLLEGLPCMSQYRPMRGRSERHALHLYVVELETEKINTHRNHIVQEMRDQGIGVALHYKAVHLHAHFQGRTECRGSLVNTERVSESIFTLPITPTLTDEQVHFIGTTCAEVIASHRR
ncbi:MAG: UDP-4-amino-4,6-dideoxy-N-acetyl-beta-L-altrosamine transaminase [Candidatus Harrisonbacteria bacterium CG10_big_fil_rev_8_21_14_0_10_42_17]|uniref:UDP-4-amino-4, 6-dideoxy-N-acetyl-beta-L-altrosamine transaminase n=1 Tax=Candidatus Harrisonbacteria bacterium CG10_big_fil_rev_8_21_14_0_10_42_17 TaxID=1974584 RepID=A0A2M6WI19_9BACT|nr:MAG: UDP-4-amino-4,6-dideoxy-N-acetyl-beta-L-altrosamine transaminase [Candidatus Harrisonbacteria bacterium CG10_big_fil_rev_8_21_14_0_10_42_17]